MVYRCWRVCPPSMPVLSLGLTMYARWLALFATFGYSSSFGVFQAYYTAVGTSTPSNISWIGSTGFFFFILTGLPAGKLVDMGYFKPTVAAGTLLYIFSSVSYIFNGKTESDIFFRMFMLSLSHPDRYYQLFLSQGVGMGVGMGLIYGPSLAVQAQYWRVRRAMAMGIVITGRSLFSPTFFNSHQCRIFCGGHRLSTHAQSPLQQFRRICVGSESISLSYHGIADRCKLPYAHPITRSQTTDWANYSYA